jgi:hypothetical protein
MGGMGRIVGIVAAWAALVVVASAADVWDTKPFTQWSDKEVEKLLTDSPWAGKASLTHARDGANLGQVPDWKLIVAVRSALPIREAVMRRTLGVGVPLPPQGENVLATPMPHYVFAITGIPRLYQTQLARSAQAARLKMKGKAAVAATDASIVLIDKDGKIITASARGPLPGPALRIVPVAQRGGGSRGGAGGGFGGFGAPPTDTDKSGITAMLVVEFPKTAPITLEDGKIEFSTVIGFYNVVREFKLKEMVFQGELSL